MAHAAAAIRLESLHRDFGDVAAVSGLSFEVRSGEVYGLLGPNGAGKTTTLRILAGMMRPSAGQVEVLGYNPSDAPIQLRSRLGFLTADTGLYARMTPREVLTFFGRVSGMTREALSARITELTAELGLAEFLDRRCEKLSSGQSQRVAIARVLVNSPDVLIVDEPTATLDVLASQFIIQRLRAEADAGRAVLLSTHHLSEAELVCDRIGVIHEGRLRAEGSVEALLAMTETHTLTEAFLRIVSGGSVSRTCPDELIARPVETDSMEQR